MKHPLLISVAVLASALVGGQHLSAQQIDYSLNVLFADPTDDQSGGDWQLVARSDEAGIMAVNVELMDIADSQFHAPSGTVGGMPVGFELDETVDFATHFQLISAQIPQDLGTMQPLFYDVGVIGGGTQPGDVGPVMMLDAGSERNIPWGMADPLGNAAWDGAVLLFSGTFGPGSIPSFASSGDDASSGLVFTSVGDAMNYGTLVPASVTTVVRDNLMDAMGIPGDYNGSGLVEQADLDLVLTNWGADGTTPPTGWTNDPPSGFIDQEELDGVLTSWGASAPGAGATLALGGAQGVPEPGTLLLLAVGLVPWVVRRPRLGTVGR